MSRIEAEQWFPGVVTALLGAGVLFVLRLTGPTSVAINGGLVFSAVAFGVAGAVLFRRAQASLIRHRVALWLMPVTSISSLILVDIRHISEHGLYIGAAAVVMFLWGILSRQ